VVAAIRPPRSRPAPGSSLCTGKTRVSGTTIPSRPSVRDRHVPARAVRYRSRRVRKLRPRVCPRVARIGRLERP
jgi:hypothetical protein